ncbi:cellulose biosynthesis cyclic di-GMP-binding regulatory protein BcsB [Sutterella sp.]|uniref:cellulose biosynthesis cyclic di-GMP-binding regulatory protein BcsB n=1 Tax=Sutterella sp. TaxID=1981025 RepID=UPI0026DF038C|nr:cellulose biosynthesis cyclic di-GMP-binding regulatory protein BcsB [Sutterella sp.]MDO5532102.1 cellulose biosynthesis cyclic di-GMP-binding regulatory protein BcsB [Sutterella sp.]
MEKTRFTGLMCAVLAAGLLAAESVPAAGEQAPAPVWRTDVMSVRVEKAPLIGLVPGGTARSVRLTGLSREQIFDFGVRADDVVSGASVDLAFQASASVLPRVSQVNVYLNGELQRSTTLGEDMIGKPALITVPLNVKAIRSQNRITVEFIGHVRSVCENPADESLWLDVSQASRLVLEKSRIRLANDITRLPAPFIDTASGAAARLPFVFASAPSSRMKEAAAVLASSAGRRTAWRGADFPVYYNALPGPEHFVVFATNADRPTFLKDLPPVAGPQVSVMDAPGALAEKMLVIAGRDEDDILTAVKALVREGNVMIGDVFRPGKLAETPPREPYDAPNWLPVGKTVQLSALMEYQGQFSSRGYRMPPVTVPVRLAPDLYMTSDANLTLSVKYRSTKPMAGEAAQFRVYLNGSLIDSDPMAATEGRGERTIALPGFYGALADNPAGALALQQENQLSFAVEYERTAEGGSPENCKSVMPLTHQMEIEPSSTIRLEGLWHEARLPDLRLFLRTGYPFTKWADLSHTVVLIAEKAGANEVSTMLNAVARMSAVTGAVADRVRVTSTASDPLVAERDVLAIGPLPTRMSDINPERALELQGSVGDAIRLGKDDAHVFRPPEAGVIGEAISAVVALENPRSGGHSVVALLSEGPASSLELNAQLANPASLRNVTGSVAVMTPSSVSSWAVGERYTVGDLPWYHKVWRRISRHPGWLVVCALASALVIGLAAFVFMRRWVGGREK